MANNLNRDITAGFVLKYTFPSIVMMVVVSLYTVVDGMFVSRLIGTDAFSAVNIAYPMLSITIGLGTMFGTGLTALVSRKMGEGKKEEADRILSFVFLAAVLFGLVITAVCLICMEDIIYLLGSNEAIFKYCYDYMLPLTFFFVPNILQLMFQSLYVADGRPCIGLVTTMIGGLANVVLDYVFIAVFKMGIAGAAWGTGIGYSIPALYGICYFSWSKRGNLHFVKPGACFKIHSRHLHAPLRGALLQTVCNGSSEMVNNVSTSVTTFLFNIIMMRLIGQDGVAAVAILLYLDFVLIAVNLGYSIGVAPLFSYNYGCGNKQKLHRLFRLSWYFCMAVGIFMTVGTIVFAAPLSAVFSHPDTRVYELAVWGLRIYAVSYLFKGYNIFASAMFTAYGDGKTSALLSFVRTLVFLVALLIGLPMLFGMDGVWYASPVAEMLALILSIVCTIKFRKVYHYC